MPLLRISHTGSQVETVLDGDGPRLSEKRELSFKLPAQEAEDIRWYLEEFPKYPLDPLPKRAKRIEQHMGDVGRDGGLEDVEDWRPLLRFTQGNPLTLTLLVGQALRDGLKSRKQIAAFVEKLQAGGAVFEDEVSEGRTRSLAASLAYGFGKAFTEAERKQLALLHLFQAFVDVDALRAMGSDLAREAGIALLDRAAEVGLLTALGGGGYRIHPALPWFFRRLFEQYYADEALPQLGRSWKRWVS